MGMGIAQTRGFPPPGVTGDANTNAITPAQAPTEGIVQSNYFNPLKPKPVAAKPAPRPVPKVAAPTPAVNRQALLGRGGFGGNSFLRQRFLDY
jgi:hypothetical protein